jgi:benzoyl-CoA reductase/2-hydroxyglutaryl-CoA dehydratase subunit BcrC/BadD/HgdB
MHCASNQLPPNLESIKREAEDSDRKQVEVAVAGLVKQPARPRLMQYYENAARFPQNRVKELEGFKRAGGKVVGYLCLFAPLELIRAAGAVPIRLESGSHSAVVSSEQLLPTDACPVVRSTLGMKMLDLSPYLRLCDILVCPASCEMKSKLGEVLEEFTTIWRIDVPSLKDGPSARRMWLGEVNSLKHKLEKLTGRKITRTELRRSIQTSQEARVFFHRLLELRKSEPAPISGGDAMLVTQTMWYDDLERWTKKTSELCEELKDRLTRGATVAKARAPRIMIVGSPIIWPNWKLPNLIEEAGAVIVCDELCSGDRGALSDPVNVNEWTMKDMMNAIVERYLLPVTCPCFTPNDQRLDVILKMVKDFRIDGVVYHQLRGCYLYKVEFFRVRAALKDFGLPTLGLETDYTHEDLGQLRTRIEAFLEMIQSTKETA